MIEEHPEFRSPPANTRLWRYMDLTKFVSMISSGCLYFPRADLLGDEWEGYVRPRDALCITDGIVVVNTENYATNIYSAMRKICYVSCWHKNSGESAAMWKLYLKSNEGIAIQTTAKRLRDSLANARESIILASVTYTDYVARSPLLHTAFGQFLSKRLSFEHEREVRAATLANFGPAQQPPGLAIPVDLNTLIEEVFVSPNTDRWVKDAIQSILERFNLDRTLRSSSLSETPWWNFKGPSLPK